MENADLVNDYLRSQQDAMLDLVGELVCMESPSTNAASQGPVLGRLRSELEAVDYRTTLIPGRQSGGHLYASPVDRERSRPRQLMIGHCDTVWPEGTLKNMPLTREGNNMHGPGIYDMKAGLVEMVFSLKALRQLGLTPEVTPLCFINSDEEIGSRESGRYIHCLARRVDRSVVMEPSLGPTGRIKTARKGVGRFTVRVRGRAAHAGLDPEGGASAILELSHVIQRLFELNDPTGGTSVNVGVIDGGVRPNVVAPESSAVVDVRVESREKADRVEAAILGLEAETPGVTLTVEGGIGRPPMEKTPRNRQLWKLVRSLGESLDLDLEQGTAGGGSDGNTTSLYTATVDGMGAVGDGAHADHEHIHVDQLCTRTALLTLLLLAPPINHASR